MSFGAKRLGQKSGAGFYSYAKGSRGLDDRPGRLIAHEMQELQLDADAVLALVGLFHRQTEAGELVVAVALADAEFEPPAGDRVHQGVLLRALPVDARRAVLPRAAMGFS